MSIGGEIKVVLTLDDSGFTLKTQKAKQASDELGAGLQSVQKTAEGVATPLADVAKTMEQVATKTGEFAAGMKQIDAESAAASKAVESAAASIGSLGQGLGDAARAALTASQSIGAANNTIANSSKNATAALLQAPSAAMKAAMANNQLGASANKAAQGTNAQATASAKAAVGNAELATAMQSLERMMGRVQSTVVQLIRSNNALAVSTEKNTAATSAATLAAEANTFATNAQTRALAGAGGGMGVVRGQADQLTGSLRAMASVWAGMKIEGGLKASVGAADEMQRLRVAEGSFNFGEGQDKAFFDKAFDLANTNKFLSQLDAVKARLAAIGSVGSNNQQIIDATLETAVKTANNLQTLGYTHGSQQDTIRNLYGVVETRQQVYDPEGAKRTMELMQKVTTATGGKVQMQDAENVLRMMGSGAARLSDDGLINLMSIVDQSKTAGGGGGGAGVSRVGTSFKMFQQYALGKQMTDQATQIFLDAGLLNTGAITSKDPRIMKQQAKHAGLTDGDLASSDPIGWLQKHADQLLAFTQKKVNQKKYYDGADINDPRAQAVAIQKLLVASGFQTTAAAAMAQAIDPHSAQRINEQRETVNNSKGVNQVNDEVQKTYAGSMQQVKAALSDIGVLVGSTVLPALASVLQSVRDILIAFKQWGAENPMVVQFSTIAAAAGGLVLALTGVGKMTGLLGSATGALGGLMGATQGASSAAAAGTGIWATYTQRMAAASTAFTNTRATGAAAAQIATQIGSSFGAAGTALGTAAGATASAGATMGGSLMLLGRTVTATASLIGRAFLRMIPWVGLLITAWDLGSLLLGLEVGGHKVSEWFGHWFDGLMAKANSFWAKMKSGFREMAEVNAMSENGASDADIAARMNQGKGERAKIDSDADAAEAKRQRKWKFLSTDQSGTGAPMGFGVDHPGHNGRNPGALDDPDPSIANAIANGGRHQHEKRQFEDPYAKFIEQLNAKSAVTGSELTALLTREPKGMAALTKDATDEFRAKWLGGDFDKAHDPRNRQWKSADGSLDTSNTQVKAAIDVMAKQKEQEEQKKALVFVNERLASSENDLQEAMSNAAEEGGGKQTREMRALERELARAEERLGTGTKGWDEWSKRKNEALANRAGADLIAFSSSFKEADRKTNSGLLPFEIQRRMAEYDATNSKDLAQYSHDQQRRSDATAAQLSTETDPDKRVQITKDAIAQQMQAEQEFNVHLAAIAAERAELLKSPMDHLVDTWKDTFHQMEDAQADWAKRGIDEFMNFAQTGQFHLGKLAESMALDVLRIKMQESFATPLKTGMDALGKAINQWVFPNASTAAGNALTDSAGSGAVGSSLSQNTDQLAKSFATLATQAVPSTTQAFSAQVSQMITSGNAQGAATTTLGSLANAALLAAQALAQISGSSVSGGGGIGGMLGGLFGASNASSAAGYSFTMPNSASIEGSGALFGSSAGMGLGAFANGGIMTSRGIARLRKYATGGVANSPQLALYGEGSMSEAYVPLPDGKSIPVTLSGSSAGASGVAGAAPAVTVNVINQTNQQVNAQQGQPRFDGRQLILDVVLSAAQQPGTFRDGMKQSMK